MKKEFTRDLTEVPIEIIAKMLERQEEQGNKRDPFIFDDDFYTNKKNGGIDWYLTPEGNTFWSRIQSKDYEHFFRLYPQNKQFYKLSTNGKRQLESLIDDFRNILNTSENPTISEVSYYTKILKDTNLFDLVLEKTIEEKEIIVHSESGPFKVLVSKKGIFYHEGNVPINEVDLESLLSTLSTYIGFGETNAGQYQIKCEKITIGCKVGVLISDLRTVLDTYKNLQKKDN